MNLGKKIQILRQKKGFTQKEFCKKTGIPYSTLSKLEAGINKEPTLKTLKIISKHLGISIDDLIKK